MEHILKYFSNLSVRQLNIAAIALLGLIFALFVIFGK